MESFRVAFECSVHQQAIRTADRRANVSSVSFTWRFLMMSLFFRVDCDVATDGFEVVAPLALVLSD